MIKRLSPLSLKRIPPISIVAPETVMSFKYCEGLTTDCVVKLENSTPELLKVVNVDPSFVRLRPAPKKFEGFIALRCIGGETISQSVEPIL